MLFKMNKGWHCGLNVFVNGQGISFEVKSEYDLPTPLEAAQQCQQRLNEALNKLAPPTLKG